MAARKLAKNQPQGFLKLICSSLVAQQGFPSQITKNLLKIHQLNTFPGLFFLTCNYCRCMHVLKQEGTHRTWLKGHTYCEQHSSHREASNAHPGYLSEACWGRYCNFCQGACCLSAILH